jgi:hypothetical protein
VVEARDVSERVEAEVRKAPALEPENREEQASAKLPGPLDAFRTANREEVLAPVRRAGVALEDASDELRNDRGWCSRR